MATVRKIVFRNDYIYHVFNRGIGLAAFPHPMWEYRFRKTRADQAFEIRIRIGVNL